MQTLTESRTQPARTTLQVPPLVGKDILELLTSAMYVDPLCIYREYVQNAADAIDEARDAGLFGRQKLARIDVDLELAARRIIVRDNGIGIAANVFSRRLAALGASKKRGSKARGFRGVGRLAGLAYCHYLIFRSTAKGTPTVKEMRWDCRKLKLLLRDHSYKGDLIDVMREVVEFQDQQAGISDHFFEVELQGVTRIKNDVLLNEAAVHDYLAQVAPIPFSPDFSFGRAITERLAQHGINGSHNIFLNGSKAAIVRPFRELFQARKHYADKFVGIEFFDVPGLNGDLDAVGWILNHGYHGALPDSSPIRGLRLRAGNMQIGGANIFESAFPERRFNGWAVGEVHLLSDKLSPNGRRDDLEQSVHQQNLVGHVAPIAKAVTKRCRTASIARNRAFKTSTDVSATPLDLKALLSKRQKAWLRRQPKAAVVAYDRALSLVYDLSRPRNAAPLIQRVFDALCRR